MILPFRLKNLAFVFLCLFLVPACSDDDDSDDSQPQNTNVLKVTINGEAWTGNIGSVASSGGTRQVNATSDNGSSIQLFFPEDTTGTFTLSSNSPITVAYSENNTLWNAALSGNFVLSSNSSSNISGVFSAELASAFSNTDTLVFTDGSYNWSAN